MRKGRVRNRRRATGGTLELASTSAGLARLFISLCDFGSEEPTLHPSARARFAGAGRRARTLFGPGR